MSASLLLSYISAALALQVGVAVAVALWRRRRAAASHAAAPRSALRTPGASGGWRALRVARREHEDRARTLCSFHLAPVDGAPLPPFVPGQYLTLAVPIGAARTLTRCYSLSDRPDARGYRISVKRVLAPAGRPELPRGACSNQLHDQLQIGDVIKAKAPAGRFVVDPEPGVSIVLIAGGVGITPLLGMLRGGPPAMMASLIPALLPWGALPGDIHYEAFGPASAQSVQASSRAEAPRASPSFDVTFRRSGRTLAWDGEDANLLDFAERHELSVESGCRSGSCGTCEVKLISGTAHYAEDPEHEVAPGHCLLCVGSPDGPLELDA